MKKVLAERSQKTQSFQWPVSAVWSTFSALVEIIDGDYDARFTRPAAILPVCLACARFCFPLAIYPDHLRGFPPCSSRCDNANFHELGS